MYIINLDEYESIENRWIALYVNGNNVIGFDCFGVKHIPKEIIRLIGNKNITANVNRIQAPHSMYGYFCIGFIKFMSKGKSLLEYTNLFSPNDYEKNDKIIINSFND